MILKKEQENLFLLMEKGLIQVEWHLWIKQSYQLCLLNIIDREFTRLVTDKWITCYQLLETNKIEILNLMLAVLVLSQFLQNLISLRFRVQTHKTNKYNSNLMCMMLKITKAKNMNYQVQLKREKFSFLNLLCKRSKILIQIKIKTKINSIPKLMRVIQNTNNNSSSNNKSISINLKSKESKCNWIKNNQ